jgi:hypothetical protein
MDDRIGRETGTEAPDRKRRRGKSRNRPGDAEDGLTG